MIPLSRRAVAEAVGTFGLVFIGCGVVLASTFPGANYGVLGIAIAHAIVLSVMISATMAISGGHLNPAVTIGLLSVGRIDAVTAAAYVVAQLIGGIFGAFLVKILFPVGVVAVSTLGTPALAANLTIGPAIAIEAVLTFFLVSAVFGTAVNPDAPKIGGFGIGLVLLFDILVGGPLTGAAMNPARAFGPAIVSGDLVAQPVWWIGPILGGIVAALLWDKVLLPKRT
ncbi:MAG: aquaporin [Gemmatimonadota bacterium]